jgi:hypothetical protein
MQRDGSLRARLRQANATYAATRRCCRCGDPIGAHMGRSPPVKRFQPVTLLLAAMLLAGGTNIARPTTRPPP